MFELKKYIEVIFHDTEEGCRIWRKSNLSSWDFDEILLFQVENASAKNLQRIYVYQH